MLENSLHAVPGVRPIRGSIHTKNRNTRNVDARRSKNLTVYKCGPAAAKSGRDHNNRPNLLLHQCISNLNGSVEADGLSLADRHDLKSGKSRNLRKQFDDAPVYSIGSVFAGSVNRNEHTRRDTGTHQTFRTLEDEIVRIEILQQ